MIDAGAFAHRLDRLVAAFNARSLDLPDGLFDRRTQFRLNGAPFETLLGRSPDDPLVLMLARGPAGYRFVVKALQHAVPDGTLARGDVAWAGAEAAQIVVWISGHLRGTGEALEITVPLTARFGATGVVDQVDAAVDAAWLERLHAARLRP